MLYAGGSHHPASLGAYSQQKTTRSLHLQYQVHTSTFFSKKQAIFADFRNLTEGILCGMVVNDYKVQEANYETCNVGSCGSVVLLAGQKTGYT